MQTACRSLRRCRPVFSITTGRKRKQKGFHGGKRSICCRKRKEPKVSTAQLPPFSAAARPATKKEGRRRTTLCSGQEAIYVPGTFPAGRAAGASCGPGKIKTGNPLQPYNDRNLFSAPTAACVCRPPGFRLQSRWLPARSRCAPQQAQPQTGLCRSAESLPVRSKGPSAGRTAKPVQRTKAAVFAFPHRPFRSAQTGRCPPQKWLRRPVPPSWARRRHSSRLPRTPTHGVH